MGGWLESLETGVLPNSEDSYIAIEEKHLSEYKKVLTSYLMFKGCIFSFRVFPDQDDINIFIASFDPFESSAPHNVAPEVQFGSVA